MRLLKMSCATRAFINSVLILISPFEIILCNYDKESVYESTYTSVPALAIPQGPKKQRYRMKNEHMEVFLLSSFKHRKILADSPQRQSH